MNETQSMAIFIDEKFHHINEETTLIKKRFLEADYPLSFIESVVNEFQKGKECEDDGFIVPSSIYEIKKSFISIERPYPKLNKTKQNIF